MSIPEMDMNPEIARKLLEVGEEFRIEGPFFSYEEIKMGNVNHAARRPQSGCASSCSAAWDSSYARKY